MRQVKTGMKNRPNFLRFENPKEKKNNKRKPLDDTIEGGNIIKYKNLNSVKDVKKTKHEED